METRVSIVAAPWRRFATAARWKGSAPHTATGDASASDAHCQYTNWSAGAIAMAITGSDSARQTSSRLRSASSAGSGAVWSPGSVAAEPVAPGCPADVVRGTGRAGGCAL